MSQFLISVMYVRMCEHCKFFIKHLFCPFRLDRCKW
nr:MAG TPA: hypothetical protein [Caudoviricetes sp.]